MKLIELGSNYFDYDKVGNDNQSCILTVAAIVLAVSYRIIYIHICGRNSRHTFACHGKSDLKYRVRVFRILEKYSPASRNPSTRMVRATRLSGKKR